MITLMNCSKTAAVVTLGCKVNQCESESIRQKLAEFGFRIVSAREPADVYVINTCTVTAGTDYQSRQAIRRAARANPQARVVVTGCYADLSASAVSGLPGVALVSGNAAKGVLPELIRRILAEESAAAERPEADDFAWSPPSEGSGRTRAFLKIQDGCEAFCAYCIVPFVRGKCRSLPEDRVANRIALLQRAGFREIVLTGIHLGTYGRDLQPRSGLPELLEGIEAGIPGDFRIRLSSLEPQEITERLISTVKDSRIICPHFHIPLQSGSDGILKRMGRPYDSAFFLRLAEKITGRLRNAAIGADVMAGFPGESEEDFRKTVDLLERAPIAYLHVFPYSKRPGTAAAAFADQVPEHVKKERTAVLRAIGREKRNRFARRFVGRELSVLVESTRDRGTGQWKGFSENYIPVLIEAGARANEMVRVVGETAAGERLFGRIA